MRYIAGIDIGNSSTEVALATLSTSGELLFVSSALAETTGIKGTLRNVQGIQEALVQATKKVGINVSDISLIRINEATPVIGDVAMETITETIITESTMIGHNPKTPGGVGLGVGLTITPQELLTRPANAPYILVVSSAFDFADIVAQRHIHMSPLDTLIYGVTHGDKVAVAIEGNERRLIFDNVAVRVSPDMRLEMHIDTDEANAAGADNPDVFATLVSLP
ncbi:PduL/EutD family phosphate acyltransferase [Escherichia albertii]|uniref:PduL/EutD family phosphate acyltransferase n=1 Tax=Escherichia albertii TaxID=208962 RepID=UPI0012317EB4|nr:PduL/EutD family phosphate acyltransferase [Escherichia albertii]